MASLEKKKADARKAAKKSSGAIATLRNARISARKARAVANTIKGQNIESAATSLAFQGKKAAGLLGTVLDSAIANADEKNMDIDKLIVSSVHVEKGPMMKRLMPRAHGRAYRIRKQTAHIKIELTEGK